MNTNKIPYYKVEPHNTACEFNPNLTTSSPHIKEDREIQSTDKEHNNSYVIDISESLPPSFQSIYHRDLETINSLKDLLGANIPHVNANTQPIDLYSKLINEEKLDKTVASVCENFLLSFHSKGKELTIDDARQFILRTLVLKFGDIINTDISDSYRIDRKLYEILIDLEFAKPVATKYARIAYLLTQK